MASDARWTDDTETLVARAEYDADKGDYQHQPPWDRAVAEVRSEYRKSARATLAALADAGLLVEPGGETRTEPLSAVISVRFTEAEAAALQHYANERTWSISDALRHIIRKRLLDEPASAILHTDQHRSE